VRAGRALAAGLAALALGGAAPEPPASDWQPIAGTWSTSGRRQSVAVGGGASATILDASGAVTLTTGDGLSRGFRGQAIGFDDGQGRTVGRCVWTDEQGDQIFSRLQGPSMQAGKRVVGTVTGGTGRYQGLEGEYSFTWQYVVPGEDGLIQGRAVHLEGRYRRAAPPR
jgi:hypothetical protein